MSLAAPTTRGIPEATGILRRAISLEKHGYLHPAILRKRISAIGTIWLLGLVALIALIIVIRRDVAATEQQQMLVGFFVLLAVATLLASTFGLFLALWNAYVYQYILALDAKSETIEYQSISVAEAALNLASDENFQKELASELKTIPNATPEALAQAAVVRLAEKAKAASAGLEEG